MTELSLIITTSLIVAGIATVIVLLLSLWLGWIFSTKTSSKRFRLIETLFYLPMAMPPIAVGYGLLLLFNEHSWLGRILYWCNLRVAFTIKGAIIAAVVVSMGIGIKAIKTSIMAIDQGQIEMARLSKVAELVIWRRIVLPQIKPAIIATLILVFIRSLGEFGATMILAGNTLGETRTIALGIWTYLETPDGDNYALILVVIAAMLSFLALLAAERWL